MKEKINIRFIGDGEADSSSYEVDDVKWVWKVMKSWPDEGGREIKAFIAYDHNGDEVIINARAIEQVWTGGSKKNG